MAAVKKAKANEPIMFEWVGTNKQGARTKGEIASTSITLAKAELRRQNIVPIKIKKKPTGIFAPREKKIKSQDLTVFSRQLATMMQSGIPLAQSFDIIGKGHDNPSMRKLINIIKSDVEAGNSLADSFVRHPKYFSKLYCNLITAGEQAGALETMLERLALYQEKTQTIKKKIKKAMMYPVTIVVIALAVSVGLLLFVVPQFEEVFKGFGAELPALTQMVVKMSKIMQEWWYIVFGILGGAIYMFVRALKISPAFSFAFDKYLLRFPIVGKILVKAIIARYARTLSTTFAAGMPLVEALHAVSGAAGNQLYAKAILGIVEKVSSGGSLNQAMEETKLFPNMVVQMIAIGEEAGSLEKMLTKVAEYYEEQVDAAVDTLSTLMEPLIMVILAFLIGGMVIAMYMPIFKLGQAV